jgi:hypothetical protein
MRIRLLKLIQQGLKKGQSFVELALILLLLLTLLTAVVEFGNLLNQYIIVVDAARAGARFASNDDPFIRTTNPFGLDANFFTNTDIIIEGAEGGRNPAPPAHDLDKGALSPIRLHPEDGDDVVISFFSIHSGTLTRFPSFVNGWSYYGHHGYSGQTTNYTTAQLEAMTSASAPDTGMVLVEIYYHYHQILGFWRLIGVPDPLEVYTYAIMPLSAAEPTPGP